MSQLLQKLKVLHISCAHLDQVHVFKQRQVVCVHNLRDDGQAGDLLCLQQQLQPVGLQALEVVGRGSGLEGAAAEHVGSCRLHVLGDGDDLVVALHGAGAGDHGEVSPAHLHAGDVNNAVQGVEFAVGALEGLGHALDGVHDVQPHNQILVQLGRVADNTHDGGKLPLGHMGDQILGLDPADQVLYSLFVYVRLYDDDHFYSPFLPCRRRNKKRLR